jgi:hypothetical protein
MNFRGLFVGIDRYQSPFVKRLNCACRDATALHALFTDIGRSLARDGRQRLEEGAPGSPQKGELPGTVP